MNDRTLKAIQPGLTARVIEVRGKSAINIEGVGERNSAANVRVCGWEPIQLLLDLCDEALTDIRAQCPHSSHDDLIALGHCEWCGMSDSEVADELKSMERLEARGGCG